MNSLMLLVAKILGVKSEGADSDVFALMEGAMNVMGIHNLLPQSARRVDIAEVATELLSGDQILIRTAGSKERFYHGIFVGPISGVQGGKNLVVDFWGSQDAGKQEANIRLRTLGEFMAVPGCPELADDSFKEESNASEEPMTTTVEDYDALLRELENCRIKNQTLIKHNDELKLISETTMHENILLKSQLVPELSPYHFGHDLLTSLNLPFCNTKCCIVLLDSSGARQCKRNCQATGLLCTTHASSPKHVAEKVNKAYATRCFERHAKVISASQTQSDCVTAYTSACDDNNYATPGLDIRTRYVMEKTGVLPSDLGKYSTEGFARDAAVLRRQLGPGFSFETLEGEADGEMWQDGQGTRDAVRLRGAQMQGEAGAPSTYYGMTVAATQQFGKTTVNSRGSKFGVALGRMFDQEVLVTYDGFETALDKYWSGAQVRMTHAFRGVFGTPALPPLVDVEEVQKDEYVNVFFDADGSLVYTIVTTTQGPFVDPDTGETRTGEPLETPIPVTEPAYEMRWMATEIDASSGVSITTLISKEDYEKLRSSMQEEE
eukprot:gene2667-biopygen8695